ncbi:transposase [Kyrpidia spormannii]|uniref:Transposase n=1 Tax=Kyrpidia spormannii TaxID=2055160 RepID=A0ACA8Z680_9BACL|nr:transposase [Kyrpidia spormannii]CAB3390223.1 transposase [Kyrpidia spormannii]
MRQTIRQKSLPLNREKWRQIVEVAEAYSRQKDAFLVEYTQVRSLKDLGYKRRIRDERVAAGFVSPFGLQARQWKLALEDALWTLERQWEAAIAEVRDRLHRNEGLTPKERDYAFWLLDKFGDRPRDWRKIEAVFWDEDLAGKKTELEPAGRKKVRHGLKRLFRRVLGKRPRIKKARSFVVDQQMYRVFMVGNRQYVAVMGLSPGKRIVIPLSGIHKLRGNLRVVLLPDEQAVEIHMSREPKTYPAGEEEAGIDLGVTEVLTDDSGKKYRPEYGQALQEMSDHVLDKGRERQKLWALYRKNRERDPGKARRIRRHNLGLVKQHKRHRRYRAWCENEINRAFRAFFRERRPRVIACEDLSHLRGKARNKGLSRKVSQWQRQAIRERLEYLCHVYSITDPGPVNAAYTSQTCPCPGCGWVDGKNRNGDSFRCQKCGYEGDADHVAATNVKGRLRDQEITKYTPHKEVKRILLKRYWENHA